ncbi:MULTISPECIES: MarR family winged helix-turn-helix transcriptional regulator [unclassified Achromobacter]|uniref:MarR family winged helix-turn-helix transcriptional regulator n=1 Tax=unclassified Achromobacter TaxID=2626865 RepID=UPI001E52FE6D|nr:MULTISPECIES: MarR family transcriptional regulator [unclassified Achromobacter]
MKATQVSLLSEIERMVTAAGGQSPALQDLASNMAVQISALTHALRPLIRDGLIELQVDESDKRVKRAVLTSSGSERLAQAIVHWAGVNRRVDDVLGKESAAQLRALADFVGSDDFLTAYGGSPADSLTSDPA